MNKVINKSLLMIFSIILATIPAISTSKNLEEKISLSRPPYQITFTLIRNEDLFYSFKVVVTCDGKELRADTDWLAKNIDKAFMEIKQLTGVKSGYLFTPGSCAGGNAWRCDYEHVFMCEGGPREIGTIYRDESATHPGGGFSKSGFKDLYDGLEDNDYTCHMAAPFFFIIRVDNGESLVVDRDKTWEMNWKQFKTYSKLITNSNLKDDKRQYAISAFLGALAIAKICDKSKQWDDVLEKGKEIFGKKDALEMSMHIRERLRMYPISRWK